MFTPADFDIYQGDTFYKLITLTEGGEVIEIDEEYDSFISTIRIAGETSTSPAGAVVFEPDVTVVSEENGEIEIELSAASTKEIDAGHYWFDLKMITAAEPEDIVRTLIFKNIYVFPEATKVYEN